MKSLRQRIAKSLFIATLTIVMVGWIFVLYQGLEWALGA
jgi:hypothetical protein